MDQIFLKNFRDVLRRLERELSFQLKNDTCCCGVTVAQCHILLEIGKRGEASIVELASALGTDTSTLSRNINGMVNIGLVNRILNTEDRRYVSITLTDQGKGLHDLIEKQWNMYFTKVFERIPCDSHNQIMQSIGLLAEAISKVKDDTDLKCCE